MDKTNTATESNTKRRLRGSGFKGVDEMAEITYAEDVMRNARQIQEEVSALRKGVQNIVSG